MRTIERTTQFKRDYKREEKRLKRKTLDDLFVHVLTSLARDLKLDDRHKDHSLKGNWKDHLECHLKPDLLLIYQKPDDKTLKLVRLGSHSELGL